RCFRGTNNNGVCNTTADCPGGGTCSQFIGDIDIHLEPLTTGTSSKSDATGIFCAAQGQTATQKGAFKSDICQTGANSGKPCSTAADCGGASCRSGTLINYCSAGTNSGKGCSTNANCGSAAACSGTGQSTCPAGETCVTSVCVGTCSRAGTLVQLVR